MKKALCTLLMVVLAGSALALAGSIETRLKAELSSTDLMNHPNAKGKSEFRERDGRRGFKVQVENLMPGDVYSVNVEGVTGSVGQVMIDRFGRAELQLRDDNHLADGELPFPPNFTGNLAKGTKVQVGPVQGFLQ